MSSLPLVPAKRISEIAENPAYSSFLQILQKSDQAQASKAVEPHLASPETLCFVSTPEHLQKALQGKASILVALNKMKLTADSVPAEVALYSTPSISGAMALILPLFDQKSQRFPIGIHPTASIDPSAQIGKEVRIGPFAIVGANARLGDGVWVGGHCVIECNAQIGARSILHPHSFIGANCQVGRHCEIHPHSTIGSDGFGYVQGPDGRRNKVPQLGIVVLEDHVELGANCAIDRATLGETRIGEGTKFDNLCHVAHNCKIGKHNVFAGGFFVAGSSEIGDNCMVGGNSVVSDHIKIGDNVILGGLAGVTKDISEPGAYAGFPIEPMKDALRTLSSLPHLASMRKQLAQIRKHLGINEE